MNSRSGPVHLRPLQQPRQLGDVHRNPPRLVTSQQLGRCPRPWLVLAIDEGELLPVDIARDEARSGLLDGPRRWEAARLLYQD